MFQDNGDRSISDHPSSIQVGQLIYSSFQDCGFRMVMTADTPLYIQRSFVEKIVNARWDPHSPPQSDFRAAYVYQSSSHIDYVVFGWLYYDGKDEFGRSGIPYFIAHYLLGTLSQGQLEIILNCIEKGPEKCLERRLNGEDQLGSLTLDHFQDYEPVRPGVSLPEEIWRSSQTALSQTASIDWFIPQQIAQDFSLEPLLVDPDANEPFQSRLHETATGSGDLTVNTKQLEATLQGLVDKTMGIQGAALISEEGNPIVPVIGLNENTSGIIAGMILYMAKETNRELNWPWFEAVTLKGPDSYLMLNFCQSGIYLLIQADKVPMGLLEGAVNRCIATLKDKLQSTELADPVEERPALMPINEIQEDQSETTRQADIEVPYPDLMLDKPSPTLKSKAEEEDDDSGLTYRGRPAK